jgi:hypothetical protein
MRVQPAILLLCALTTACQDKKQTMKLTPETSGAAAALDDFSVTHCPLAANLSQFEDTSLTNRHKYGAPPDLGVFGDLKQGCAVLTFTVRDQGIVSGSSVLSEYPAGFGAVASKILRWNDYAEGAYADTVFVVRLGAETLPQGGAMTSLAFKGSTINLVVPP